MNEPTLRAVRSRPPQKRKSAADALSGIWALALSAFVIGIAWFGREIIVPLALAALLTFLLIPLVDWLERWIGRVAAVILTMLMILGGTIGAGWSLTHQAVDLASRLPEYKENLRAKLQSIQLPSGAGFKRLSETFEDLKKDLPAGLGAKPEEKAKPADGASQPLRVKVIEDQSAHPLQLVQSLASPVLGPLGTASLVLLLVTFMLLKHEDLRSRFIRLMGQGRISSTTRALDDAGMRIRRYLLMQLVVNLSYGFALFVGLYFIGVPNALLWGALAAGLRFIPYIGPWIAASFPMLLSLVVSPSWWTPAFTLALFIAIELVTNNVLEPWLYGSSTGVSSIALIVAAVFWTWLWGPVGLVLSTPLTVCLVVMGRHIPQLSFLSVLLSEEDALTPAEDLYHRLLRRGEHDESDQIEAYLKESPLNDLYDTVLIPVMIAAEEDYARGMVDEEQREWVIRALRSIVEDLDHNEPASSGESSSQPVCRVYCIPARAERDELVGAMLANALHHEGFDARHSVGRRMAKEMVSQFSEDPTDIVFISAVEPSTANHARSLCERIRASVPDQKIVVGLWGREGDLDEVSEDLKMSGADEVFATIAEAVAFCEGFALQWADDVMEAPRPDNEDERQHSLEELHLLSSEPSPALDRLTAKLARVFEIPVASVTLVDRHRQFFKSSSGLPASLRETPRDLSVCGHVVFHDELMVVEDLLRDRRFANNLFLKQHGLRFYAGAPIHASDGQPIGSLCLMDTKPRRFSKRERRLLAEHAAELSREIGQLPEDT
ncbi:AI-2E family transporter [Luteolibacter sp. LG18]|uniref:AI-2E family transporter n=1 Tax=Luteolibacter sp. LG18 TaxID=2819286 RepID=UPI002B2E511D|nr:hypothetical protein llg_34400 [Luteolibacter sp. LG18]